jgi:hypothetical protein
MNFRLATRMVLSRDRKLLVGVKTAASGPLIRVEAGRFGKTSCADILPDRTTASWLFAVVNAVVNEPDVRQL